LLQSFTSARAAPEVLKKSADKAMKKKKRRIQTPKMIE
jgi:hypothetical protein